MDISIFVMRIVIIAYGTIMQWNQDTSVCNAQDKGMLFIQKQECVLLTVQMSTPTSCQINFQGRFQNSFGIKMTIMDLLMLIGDTINLYVLLNVLKVKFLSSFSHQSATDLLTVMIKLMGLALSISKYAFCAQYQTV